MPKKKNPQANPQKKKAKSGKKAARNRSSPSGSSSSSKGVGWNSAVKLSGCARGYMNALADPINGPLACIPDYPALFSRRVRVWSKGTFSTSNTAPGTSFGFICFDPLRMAASDLVSVVSTTAAYATAAINLAAGAGISNGGSNSDYAAADFGAANNQVQGRVVSACLRLRYIGTELNRGGRLTALMQPLHANLNAATLNVLDSFDESKKFPITRDWITVLYRPVDNSDLSYTGDPTQGTLAAPYSGNSFYMGAIVVDPGGTANPSSYEFECYSVMEFQGDTVRGKTPSSFDPVGFGIAHGATQHNLSILEPTSSSLQTVASNVLAAGIRYGINELTTVQRVPSATLQADALSGGGKSSGFDWWGMIGSGIEKAAPFVMDAVAAMF